MSTVREDVQELRLAANAVRTTCSGRLRLGQEPPSLPGAELELDHRCGVIGVGAAVRHMVRSQAGDLGPRQARPLPEGVLDPRALREMLELDGPGPERGGLRRKRDVDPVGRLAICLLEVLHEHREREAVDGEVMDGHEQEVRRARATVEVSDPEQRSPAQVEAPLQLGADALDRRGTLRDGQPGQVMGLERDLVRRRRDLLAPVTVLLPEPETQCVVVQEQGAHGRPKRLRGESRRPRPGSRCSSGADRVCDVRSGTEAVPASVA